MLEAIEILDEFLKQVMSLFVAALAVARIGSVTKSAGISKVNTISARSTSRARLDLGSVIQHVNQFYTGRARRAWPLLFAPRNLVTACHFQGRIKTERRLVVAPLLGYDRGEDLGDDVPALFKRSLHNSDIGKHALFPLMT